MSSDYNLLKQIEESVISRGYPIVNRGLIVFGGKNNGTVDLKASNQDSTKSIIIEIKSSPVHLIDLSQFLSLKRNIETHNTNKREELAFYLITSEVNISPTIRQLAKSKGIIVENIIEFLKRNKL